MEYGAGGKAPAPCVGANDWPAWEGESFKQIKCLILPDTWAEQQFRQGLRCPPGLNLPASLELKGCSQVPWLVGWQGSEPRAAEQRAKPTSPLAGRSLYCMERCRAGPHTATPFPGPISKSSQWRGGGVLPPGLQFTDTHKEDGAHSAAVALAWAVIVSASPPPCSAHAWQANTGPTRIRCTALGREPG